MTKKAGKARKDSQLVIRLNGALRDRFVALCEAQDTSASREVRGFIKAFLARHEDGPALDGQEKEKKEWRKKPARKK